MENRERVQENALVHCCLALAVLCETASPEYGIPGMEIQTHPTCHESSCSWRSGWKGQELMYSCRNPEEVRRYWDVLIAMHHSMRSRWHTWGRVAPPCNIWKTDKKAKGAHESMCIERACFYTPEPRVLKMVKVANIPETKARWNPTRRSVCTCHVENVSLQPGPLRCSFSQIKLQHDVESAKQDHQRSPLNNVNCLYNRAEMCFGRSHCGKCS